MQLRKRDLKTCYLKHHIVKEDGRGNSNIIYSDKPKEIKMTVQSAGGYVMASIYGSKLPYIKSCKYQGKEIQEGRNENDGICLNVPKDSKPDYSITQIQTFSTHVNVTLERL